MAEVSKKAKYLVCDVVDAAKDFEEDFESKEKLQCLNYAEGVLCDYIAGLETRIKELGGEDATEL